jgi:hypothetical protein
MMYFCYNCNIKGTQSERDEWIQRAAYPEMYEENPERTHKLNMVTGRSDLQNRTGAVLLDGDGDSGVAPIHGRSNMVCGGFMRPIGTVGPVGAVSGTTAFTCITPTQEPIVLELQRHHRVEARAAASYALICC